MQCYENDLTYEEYVGLRESVGWSNYEKDFVENAIHNSIYGIKIVENKQTIAMGRLIGDGLYYLIVDVVVMPEFQGKGIGSGMLDRILKYIEIRTPVGGRASVQLIAEKGKEEFYIKKGFKRIPHEFCGSGMRKVIRKCVGRQCTYIRTGSKK